MPFLSMDAERAARQIVHATRRGDAERILSLPAVLLSGFHGLFPGATATMLGVANRMLPAAGGDGAQNMKGHTVRGRVESSLLNGLMSMGLSAARRFNEEGTRQQADAPAE
jgi:hypothetical protein